MVTMLVVGLILVWMLLSTIIIIGVAMATSQGSRRELRAKPTLDPTENQQIKLNQKRGRLTRPRPQWAEGPPRSMKPFQN